MASSIGASPTEFDETVESVLCALDRWTARNDGHHTEKRTTRRHAFRAQVEVAARVASSQEIVRFHAFTRDISVSGLSFVASKHIHSEVGGQVILTSGLLTEEKVILICLPHGDHEVNLFGEIRRLRKVHDNLYECGVKFVGRDANGDAEPAAEAPPETATETATESPDAKADN
ncbi:MAG: PilZ domain-containing protein [Planctomycetia bacterium]|nr:PilZ domain-containing protein [Planctomycetia bacterium]